MKACNFKLWLILLLALIISTQSTAWGDSLLAHSEKLDLKTFTSMTRPEAGTIIDDQALDEAVRKWGEENIKAKIVRVESDISTSRDGNSKIVLVKTVFIYYVAR